MRTSVTDDDDEKWFGSLIKISVLRDETEPTQVNAAATIEGGEDGKWW